MRNFPVSDIFVCGIPGKQMLQRRTCCLRIVFDENVQKEKLGEGKRGWLGVFALADLNKGRLLGGLLVEGLGLSNLVLIFFLYFDQ